MKRQAYTLIALMVLIGSIAVAAKAQSNGRIRLTANIPFEFSIGGKKMPAGKYTVTQVNPASDRVVLQLRNPDGSASVMLQMNAVIARAQHSAKLVFNRYGNHYFFAQAWVDGENTGLQAPKSRAELAVQRELAAVKSTAETVALKRQ